ncbi:IMP4 protein, partial [Atractosteus spatula]|nr:IMP4 protein [Atractosteus spatula]
MDDEYKWAGVEDPKIMITTSRDPSSRLKMFAKEMKLIFPGAQRMNRGNHEVVTLVKACRANEVTDLVILHETRGQPDGMIVCHLPFGPTAYFTLYNVVMRHDIPDIGTMSEAFPHLIFHNFSSRLGKRVSDILKYLFPVPKDESRRVVTFSNQEDYISFRGVYLGRRVDGKLQLGLLPVVHRQPLHEQRGKPRASSTSKAVEDEETLQARALSAAHQLADAIQHQVHDLLADSVVPTGVVVCCILLACDELLRVEQLPVGPRANLICTQLCVHEHGPGHVLARPGLAEEGVEGVVSAADGLVAGHLAIGLDAVLQAVQLPAGVAYLHTRLAHMDGDALTLKQGGREAGEAVQCTSVATLPAHRADTMTKARRWDLCAFQHQRFGCPQGTCLHTTFINFPTKTTSNRYDVLRLSNP